MGLESMALESMRHESMRLESKGLMAAGSRMNVIEDEFERALMRGYQGQG